MIIYEVDLAIEHDIYNEFTVWLDEHVKQMLQFPGFVQATILMQEKNPTDYKKHLTVQYQIQDRSHLESYFTEHASAMREDGIKHFTDRFTAERRIFEVKSTIIK